MVPPLGRPPFPQPDRATRVATFLPAELRAWVVAQSQPREPMSRVVARLLQTLKELSE